MYSSILISHIIISVVLTIVAFCIVNRSIFGYLKNISFSNFADYYIPVFAVALLYLELILGLLLYYMHMNKPASRAATCALREGGRQTVRLDVCACATGRRP